MEYLRRFWAWLTTCQAHVGSRLWCHQKRWHRGDHGCEGVHWKRVRIWG